MRERQLDLFASDGDANEPDAEIRPKESSKRRVLKKSLSRYELSVGVGPLERAIYRVCRSDPAVEMTWPTYAFTMLAFTVASIALTYVVLRTQAWLPLNPRHFEGLAPDLAWNTAVSFATTTDWQFYSGESTLSYFSQMVALAWQNFVAAGVGLATAIALVRGLGRERSATVGNFWVDLTRGVLYVLLPVSIVVSLVFLWQGVPQNFSS